MLQHFKSLQLLESRYEFIIDDFSRSKEEETIVLPLAVMHGFTYS